ncbi:hypothetical protein [Falsiroseomonas sp. E2-1-a20]|uniref:hypothetical protein n=1 Tax=Falsiroseomonas sp. E2-1-a20 TaxID=3239300 RepID=UPI003F3F0228
MFRRLALTAAFSALLLGAAIAPAAAQCDTRFTLRNDSGQQVNEFYFGPSAKTGAVTASARMCCRRAGR